MPAEALSKNFNPHDPWGDRRGFVIKVYSIIACMLFLTVAWTALLMVDAFGDSKELIFNNLWLYWLSLLMVIGLMIGMTCFYKKCRDVPKNYILLGTYTVFHSYLIGAITIQYDPTTVITAAVATLVMFLSLTAYAFKTKTDFTKMGGFLATASMMVLLFIIMAVLFRSAIMYTGLICVMIALLSVFIVYDTQLIIGGRSKYD